MLLELELDLFSVAGKKRFTYGYQMLFQKNSCHTSYLNNKQPVLDLKEFQEFNEFQKKASLLF
jgi:hypothetical protein